MLNRFSNVLFLVEGREDDTDAPPPIGGELIGRGERF
jgi:hypothetical protein